MIKGINHITISVNDLDRAYDFYKNILSGELVFKSNKTIYFEISKIWIALVYDKKYKPSNNYSHIAFTIDEDKYYKYKNIIKKHKVKIWQNNKTEGNSLYICDPSGNKLELHTSDLKIRLSSIKQNDNKNEIYYIK